jgi:hypothetical protein
MNHTHHGHNEMPDPEKIKEILNVVSEKVPGLLKELSNVLYGADKAEQYGEAVAIFYNQLKEAGMSEEQAFELTRQYMSTLNIGNMMKGFNPHAEE